MWIFVSILRSPNFKLIQVFHLLYRIGDLEAKLIKKTHIYNIPRLLNIACLAHLLNIRLVKHGHNMEQMWVSPYTIPTPWLILHIMHSPHSYFIGYKNSLLMLGIIIISKQFSCWEVQYTLLQYVVMISLVINHWLYYIAYVNKS